MTTKNNIRTYREQAGLTQAAVAQAIGVEASAISNYERNYRTPDIQTIKDLISLFRSHGIDADFESLFPSNSVA